MHLIIILLFVSQTKGCLDTDACDTDFYCLNNNCLQYCSRKSDSIEIVIKNISFYLCSFGKVCIDQECIDEESNSERIGWIIGITAIVIFFLSFMVFVICAAASGALHPNRDDRVRRVTGTE